MNAQKFTQKSLLAIQQAQDTALAHGQMQSEQVHLLHALLTPEDSQKVSAHFRNKVKRAREEAHVQGVSVNYADLIRSVLDYRSWYEFRLFYQRGEDGKKELSDRAFNKFSGGEKAMAMYVPLFASVSAQYQKGGASCPQILALDEAFAGALSEYEIWQTDEEEFRACAEIVHCLV